MNKNKIYIRLKGGLGNQLFIYAFAIYCKTHLGCDILIDDFTGYVKDVYGRKPMLEIIGIKFKKTTVLENLYITLCRKFISGNITYLNLEKNPDIIFYEKKLKNKNLYIEGYFQNIKYFNEIKQIIFQKINLDLIVLKNNYLKKINPVNDICIHHRVADYNFITESLFFEKAFETIESKINKPRYYVFSDSIDIGVLGIHKKALLAKFLKKNLKKTDDNYEIQIKNHPLYYIRFPLYGRTKEDLLEKAQVNGYDDILQLTWSCWFPKDGKPCTKCPMCKERIVDHPDNKTN